MSTELINYLDVQAKSEEATRPRMSCGVQITEDGKIHLVKGIEIVADDYNYKKDKPNKNVGKVYVAAMCGCDVSGRITKNLWEIADDNHNLYASQFCQRCLALIGVIEPPSRTKVTEIALNFFKEHKDAIELLEALEMKNTSTDTVAKNGHLRFEDPKLPRLEFHLSIHGTVYRSRKGQSTTIKMNRTKKNAKGCRETIDLCTTRQAARVATWVIKNRKK